ncbi:YjfI family protein [Shewanella sp. YIC-542]|uniref:YjfI family protein n=1 Tax=Shewanella mytili TaxID=3377111 RepID=UPI00398E79E8
MNIHTIANHLNELGDNSSTGQRFDCYPIDGDVEVLQVNVVGREEIPIFVSVTENQILCISYLWGENEVQQESRTEMFETMLGLNIPMPLSSFAKIDDKYVLFGALSLDASVLEIEQELSVLSDNCLEVIDEMADYLK